MESLGSTLLYDGSFNRTVEVKHEIVQVKPIPTDAGILSGLVFDQLSSDKLIYGELLKFGAFTHPDSDHIGGADMILAEYEVLNVIKPEFEKTTKVYKAMMDAIAAEGCTVYNALPGETYSLGEFDMFVFGPDPTNKDLDSNNSSIVIKATWGKTTAMLTGDAEKPAEESILRTYSGAELGSMLLKMGHHGSRTSSTEAWLAAVRPTIAIISCGKDNSYGHPHAEALARIEPYVGELIYRTDLLGSIVFISNGETFIYQD
jgi:competence protein ComEC